MTGTRAGLDTADARGRKGGRKPVSTPDKLARARAQIPSGLTVREAAARVKVGNTALYEALKWVHYQAKACRPSAEQARGQVEQW